MCIWGVRGAQAGWRAHEQCSRLWRATAGWPPARFLAFPCTSVSHIHASFSAAAAPRPFMFPPVENMGQVAVRIEELTHGYNGDKLFQDAGGGSGSKHTVAALQLPWAAAQPPPHARLLWFLTVFRFAPPPGQIWSSSVASVWPSLGPTVCIRLGAECCGWRQAGLLQPRLTAAMRQLLASSLACAPTGRPLSFSCDRCRKEHAAAPADGPREAAGGHRWAALPTRAPLRA